MATATLVGVSSPSTLFTPSALDRRNSSALSTPALRSYTPQPGALDSSASSGDTNLPRHTPSYSASASFGSSASLSNATHAKLHKKSHRKALSHSHLSSAASNSSDPASSSPLTARASDRGDDYFGPSASATASSSRSSKLRRNFKKLTQPPKDDPIPIDLSRTAEENAQRSGIAISQNQVNASAPSPSLADVHFVRARAHGRSLSATSNQSAGSASFTPSLPFVHPLRQQQDSSPADPHYTGSVLGNDYSLSGLGIDTDPAEARRSFNSSRAPSSSHSKLIYDPPRWTGRASDADIIPYTTHAIDHEPSQREISHSSSFASYTAPASSNNAKPVHSRRGTGRSQRSADQTVSTSSNRTSFSIMRSPALGSINHRSSVGSAIDPAELGLERERERTASIQAARRAFAEREEAKARKYELQERKAAERRDRKLARAEERRHRRKSDVDEVQRPVSHRRSGSGGIKPPTRPRAMTLPVELEPHNSYTAHDDDDSDSHIDEVDEYESELATPSESGLHMAVSHQARSSRRSHETNSLDSRVDAAPDPKISKKRQAKGGYLGFVTWFKVRMLRMAKPAADDDA